MTAPEKAKMKPVLSVLSEAEVRHVHLVRCWLTPDKLVNNEMMVGRKIPPNTLEDVRVGLCRRWKQGSFLLQTGLCPLPPPDELPR